MRRWLLLRADNADARITRRAAEVGLVGAEALSALRQKSDAGARIHTRRLSPSFSNLKRSDSAAGAGG